RRAAERASAYQGEPATVQPLRDIEAGEKTDSERPQLSWRSAKMAKEKWSRWESNPRPLECHPRLTLSRVSTTVRDCARIQRFRLKLTHRRGPSRTPRPPYFRPTLTPFGSYLSGSPGSGSPPTGATLDDCACGTPYGSDAARSLLARRQGAQGRRRQ